MAEMSALELICLIEELDRRLYAPIALLYIKLREANAAPPQQLDNIMLRAWDDPCGTLDKLCRIARDAGIDAKICHKPPRWCQNYAPSINRVNTHLACLGWNLNPRDVLLCVDHGEYGCKP